MRRVNFKIDEETKEEIERFVQENKEYNNMSHFFRLLASQEMEGGTEQVHQTSPRVARTLDKIVGELEELREQTETIAVQVSQDETNIETLAQEVYETLPVAPVATSAEAAAAGVSAQQLDQRHADTVMRETQAPSTIPELAQHFGRDKEDIKDAIHRLKANFLPILELVDEDGNKHFLKQEERR